MADFIAVDAAQVARMPSNLDYAQAAALPLVAITAWEGLVDKARLKSGDKVLVHGGTGGVGHLALQLAKINGAQVTASVGTGEGANVATTLGADNVVNYKDAQVADYVSEFAEGGFDIVFDSVGGENFHKVVEAARFNGQVVGTQMFGEFNLAAAASKALSVHLVLMLVPLIHGVGRAHHGEILNKIARLVEEGSVKPLLHQNIFTFSDVAKAHQAFENGEVRGKLVLINDSWQKQ